MALLRSLYLFLCCDYFLLSIRILQIDDFCVLALLKVADLLLCLDELRNLEVLIVLRRFQLDSFVEFALIRKNVLMLLLEGVPVSSELLVIIQDQSQIELHLSLEFWVV
jgi:hypothetical protein